MQKDQKKEDLGTLYAKDFLDKLIELKGDMSQYWYCVTQPVHLSNVTLNPDIKDYIVARKRAYNYGIKLGKGSFLKLTISELEAPLVDISEANFRVMLEFCEISTEIKDLNLGGHPFIPPFKYYP